MIVGGGRDRCRGSAVIMVHAMVVVRRHGRDKMTEGMSAMLHAGCGVRTLQARAGLPGRAA